MPLTVPCPCRCCVLAGGVGYDDHSIVTLATWLSGRSACLLCCCFAGGVGYDDPIFVEYDLDSEDEAWLAAYNGSEVRRAAHAVHAALCRACCFVPWYSLLAACYFKLKVRAWEHSGGTASSCCTQLPQLACCCSVHQPPSFAHLFAAAGAAVCREV